MWHTEKSQLVQSAKVTNGSDTHDKNEFALGESSDRCVTVESVDRAHVLHATTNLQTLINLLKSMVGPGILAMPQAFLSAGLWMGTVSTLIIGFICLHCMSLLVRSSQILCLRTDKVALDYGQVGEMSLLTGPQCLRRFARIGRHTINLFLNTMIFGICAVYIVFVATNVKKVVDEYAFESPDVRIYMFVVAAVLIPFCFIKHLTILAYFMGLANIFIVVGLLIILQYIVQDLPDVSSRPAVNSTRYFPLYFGTTLFAYEGIGSLLPLENKMITPSDLGGYCGVMTLGVTICISVFTAIGFFGYLKFGDAVRGSITLNLPQSAWLYSLAKIMFATEILISYAIQFYVPMTVLWPWFKERIASKRLCEISEYLFRAVAVLFTLILAAGVPNLGLLISLVGSFSSTSLTIVFPPLIDLLVQKADDNLTLLIVIKNVFLFLFGIAGMVTGVILSVNEIVHSYN